MSFAAQMLDELMGRDRDANPTDKRREIHWEDPETCKYFLCGFCPHELFVNTRADLGPCDKMHDPELKKAYEKSSRYQRAGYEEDFLRFLQSLLTDVERRIRRGQQRLALNNAQGSLTMTPQAAREEKVQMLTERINELVEQAEHLGCEGKVEEAQGVMKLCEQLRDERAQLELMDEKNQQQGSNSSKDMEVCEVCGALLVVGDAQQRLDEHIMGKQHMGYARIRSHVETNKSQPKRPPSLTGGNSQRIARADDPERDARIAKEKEEREKEREKEREERKKKMEEREKERESRNKRSGSRERGSRKHGRRSRSRDKDRERDRERRHRSRSKERRRSRSRHRSRERGRHSSRERRRSRSGHRHRSNSRSRHGSSRDKDRRSRDNERSSKDRSSKDRHKDRERDEKDSKSRSRDEDAREKEQETEVDGKDDKQENQEANGQRENRSHRTGTPSHQDQEEGDVDDTRQAGKGESEMDSGRSGSDRDEAMEADSAPPGQSSMENSTDHRQTVDDNQGDSN